MKRAKKKGEKSPGTAKKSIPGPKKKTKENFEQQQQGIVDTHTCTLTPLILLVFPISHER